MENKINSLTFVSYNSTGFSVDKQQFLNKLLTVLQNNKPTVCGQEHFVQSGNKKTKHLLQKVITAFPGYKCFATPAIKANNEIIGGRAKGGLWISQSEYLDTYVRRVKSHHWRVQFIIFEFEHSRICLINIYNPTDPRIVNEEAFNDDELHEVCRAIEKIGSSESFDELIIAGDRNADFDWVNAFVNRVKKLTWKEISFTLGINLTLITYIFTLMIPQWPRWTIFSGLKDFMTTLQMWVFSAPS